MAVAFEMRFEGATLEQYDRVMELMGLDQGDTHATAVGSIRSADGVGHGPFAGRPCRSRCCQRL